MIQKVLGGSMAIEAFWTSNDKLSLDISISVTDWKKQIDWPERVRIPGKADWQINVCSYISFGTEEEFGGEEVDFSAVTLMLDISLLDSRNNPFRLISPCVASSTEQETNWTIEEKADCQGLIITGNVGGFFETGLRVSFRPASPVAA